MSSPSRSDLSPNVPEGHAALSLFQLSPDLIYLNHGAYGAVPRAVTAEQDRLRALMERDPTGFYKDFLPDELRRMAGVAAARFGGRADDWVFCENATSAVNSVLASFPLGAGDEILTTSHAYGAVLKAMQVWASRRGARVVIADIPAIAESEDQIVTAIAGSFTKRTRLLVVDHITSATATVFPVARIAKAARDADIAVLVDGAHAPGQITVDVGDIGADWYTGNAHKWLFAPRACGILWTAPSRQSQTLPVVLSHGTPDGYRAAFDWIGTRDVTPWLCFEAAARQHDAFGGRDLLRRNKNLADAAAQLILKRRRGRVVPGSLRAGMAAIALGPLAARGEAVNTLRGALLRKFGVVVPVFGFAGDLWLRISAQIYNETDDYVRLADGLAYFLDGAESR